MKAISWIAVLLSSTTIVSACSKKYQREEAVLDGEWQGTVAVHEGDTVQVVMDFQKTGSRWLGTYDVAQYGMEDYPVEVVAAGDSVTLLFSRPETHFEGKIASPGVLSGMLSHDTPIPVTFHRTGEAKFSESFLKVEHAADDSSLVEVLSSDAAALRGRFNADVTKTRLVMLLSPT